MARINLLPWREEQRTQKQRGYIGTLIGAAIISVLIVLGVHVDISNRIDHQNSRNTYLDGEIAIVDKKIVEIKELEKTKRKLLARMEVIQQLQGSRPEVVHLFEELASTVPDGVSLSAISRQGKNVTLNGRAQSNARVSAYMRNLDDSAWLASPNLNIIETRKAANSRTSKFTLKVKEMKKKAPKEAKS